MLGIDSCPFTMRLSKHMHVQVVNPYLVSNPAGDEI